MQIDEYFIKGNMYMYGGIPSKVYRWYQYSTKQNSLRNWLYIEGLAGDPGRYYPVIGDYFMCLGAKPKTIKRSSSDDLIATHIIKFLSPENKIILDVCSRVSQRVKEKWLLAPGHLEEV